MKIAFYFALAILDDNTISPLLLAPIIIGLVALLTIVAVRVVSFINNKRKTAFKNDSEIWLIALGNKDNIKEFTATRSRLSLVLLDVEIIDREKLKQLGVTSIIVMSKKVTLVIENEAEKIASIIDKSIH